MSYRNALQLEKSHPICSVYGALPNIEDVPYVNSLVMELPELPVGTGELEGEPLSDCTGPPIRSNDQQEHAHYLLFITN